MTAADSKKRKTTDPPAGYVCNLCHTAGHWIQQCSQKPSNKKSKSNHVPVVGVDPSQENIERAKELQKIKPPNCFCGGSSRLKKVKKSNVDPENSRANGNYFFFCAKKKEEDPCRFARPVEDEMKPKKERYCTFMLKKGTCRKGDKCMFSHDIPEELLESTTQKRPSKQEMKNAKKARANKDGGSDSDDSDSDSSSDDDSDTKATEKKADNNDNEVKLGSDIKHDKDDSDESVSDSADSDDKEPVKKELFKEKETKDDNDSSSDSSSDDSDGNNNDKEESSKKEADKEDSDDSSSDDSDGDEVY